MGKSSDTPKEVKNARREEIPPVLGKPADMGRDVFIYIQLIPVIVGKTKYSCNSHLLLTADNWIIYINYNFIQG